MKKQTKELDPDFLGVGLAKILNKVLQMLPNAFHFLFTPHSFPLCPSPVFPISKDENATPFL
jgi:hypothetical protein